ncbi:MAG: protein translocase subunit SecF [Pseudomonadota bacterium]
MSFKIKFPFIKYRKIFIALSIFVIAASIFFIATKGFNYGIDFNGGAKLEYQFSSDVTESQVREALKESFNDVSVVRFGESKDRRMSIKIGVASEHAQIGTQVTQSLEKTFGAGNVTLEQEETVGPKVGKEMRRKAFYTILFSWLLMLIYIGYRFDFLYAPGAVVALIHDVIIVLGFFALLGKEINLVIVAAILTLIGYSINDTIVVFDRIRENKGRISHDSIEEVVNDSLNSTLSRTLITSVTVLLVVLALFFKGGGTLHDFAFALIVGVITGTYSSIFIASPVYIDLYKYWPKVSALWGKK